ncbi:MAG: hypothetical protein Q9M32_04380 [Sulfurimonas sp.]|nr:hypothetical protein [Sulfurimonas sp.]MDQ7061949.1 hypothetical protein [Sulfurimonas sp.]
MIKKIFLSSSLALLLLSGCSTNNGPEYDGRSYEQIKTSEMGVIVKSRPIVISDTGTGKSTGAVIGSVAGSAAGYNSGNWLVSMGAAVIGGLAGAAVGSEVGKADGSELTVELDDGRRIIIVVKRDDLFAGDRVEIIKNGGKVEQVNKVE